MKLKLAVITAFAVIILAWFSYDQLVPPFKRGDAAPAFALKDLNGNTVQLSDFAGSPVLIHFWATWCGQCVMEMPLLNDLKNTFPEIKVLAINEDEEGIEAIEPFFDGAKFDHLVLLDSDGKVADQYKSYKVPESYLIDKNGKVLHRFIGPVEWNKPKIIAFVKKLLNEQSAR